MSDLERFILEYRRRRDNYYKRPSWTPTNLQQKGALDDLFAADFDIFRELERTWFSMPCANFEEAVTVLSTHVNDWDADLATVDPSPGSRWREYHRELQVAEVLHQQLDRFQKLVEKRKNISEQIRAVQARPMGNIGTILDSLKLVELLACRKDFSGDSPFFVQVQEQIVINLVKKAQKFQDTFEQEISQDQNGSLRWKVCEFLSAPEAKREAPPQELVPLLKAQATLKYYWEHFSQGSNFEAPINAKLQEISSYLSSNAEDRFSFIYRESVRSDVGSDRTSDASTTYEEDQHEASQLEEMKQIAYVMGFNPDAESVTERAPLEQHEINDVESLCHAFQHVLDYYGPNGLDVPEKSVVAHTKLDFKEPLGKKVYTVVYVVDNIFPDYWGYLDNRKFERKQIVDKAIKSHIDLLVYLEREKNTLSTDQLNSAINSLKEQKSFWDDYKAKTENDDGSDWLSRHKRFSNCDKPQNEPKPPHPLQILTDQLDNYLKNRCIEERRAEIVAACQPSRDIMSIEHLNQYLMQLKGLCERERLSLRILEEEYKVKIGSQNLLDYLESKINELLLHPVRQVASDFGIAATNWDRLYPALCGLSRGSYDSHFDGLRTFVVSHEEFLSSASALTSLVRDANTYLINYRDFKSTYRLNAEEITTKPFESNTMQFEEKRQKVEELQSRWEDRSSPRRRQSRMFDGARSQISTLLRNEQQKCVTGQQEVTDTAVTGYVRDGERWLLKLRLFVQDLTGLQLSSRVEGWSKNWLGQCIFKSKDSAKEAVLRYHENLYQEMNNAVQSLKERASQVRELGTAHPFEKYQKIIDFWYKVADKRPLAEMDFEAFGNSAQSVKDLLRSRNIFSNKDSTTKSALASAWNGIRRKVEAVKECSDAQPTGPSTCM